MINEHLEELASLHSLGLLDEAGERELAGAATLDPELLFLRRDLEQVSALLAYSVPQVKPPQALKADIMAEVAPAAARIIPFSLSTLVPYAAAACFLLFGLYEAGQIGALKTQLSSSSQELARLQTENNFQQVRLAQLEAQDAKYKQASVVLAWNPAQHSGVISASNLPAAPVGHDYQLWALPTEPGKAPISAGVISSGSGPQNFALGSPVAQAQPKSGQGFAISVEPSGGSASPTGQIIFVSAH